jgi:hypothetical protein
MSTLTGHGARETARFGKAGASWSAQHAVAATIGIIVAAIVCGVLIGLLIKVATIGPATTVATHHVGGAHGRAAALARMRETRTAQNAAAQREADAAQTAQGTAQSGPSSNQVRAGSFTRSPARGGFAGGRGHVGTSGEQP